MESEAVTKLAHAKSFILEFVWGNHGNNPNSFMQGIRMLSITHNLEMRLGNQGPSGSQILQSFPSAPDDDNAWFSIGLASQETAELGNPTNGLTGRWDRLG